MKDKYLAGLLILFFIVCIILSLQIFFLLEKPKKRAEKEKIANIILENNELRKRIKKLLVEKRENALRITRLVEDAKIKDEQIREIISKKPKEVIKYIKDPSLEKGLLELSEKGKRLALEKNKIDKRLKEAQGILSMKEEEIKALKSEIENKEKQEAVLMAEVKDALEDAESKERIKSLEEEKIALTNRILSLQEKIGELSKKVDELSSQNELILKEREDLLERIAFSQGEKEKIIKESEKQISEILKKKEEEISKINAIAENEKKIASKKSIVGNILTMFLLWKK